MPDSQCYDGIELILDINAEFSALVILRNHIGTHAVALLEAFLSARDAAASAKEPEGPKEELSAEPICLANVHRLDKDTSGVLLLSKSAAASAALGREFKGRRVSKRYWAAMYGNVQAPAVHKVWHFPLLPPSLAHHVLKQCSVAPFL